MDTSKFLSKVIGLYFIIISTAMFVNMHHFVANVKLLTHYPSLMFVTGFMTLILGLVMVVSHNIWKWNWQVVITIIAWVVLLKGLSILFLPQEMDKVSISFVEHEKFAYVAAALDFVLGLFLCYTGFIKKD